ncbi:sulfite reductase [Haematococcus lacustris]|uniref:Sulfite reductase n=1 Tax=Haematococcus lacustris TaxID=44745 RepID=A0A699Z3I8_HAELA|nr:sulfite reductase [Haematococcus lacustris]
MSRVKPVRGLSWDTGAVGTAIWSGALLRDVLLAAASCRAHQTRRPRHMAPKAAKQTTSHTPWWTCVVQGDMASQTCAVWR